MNVYSSLKLNLIIRIYKVLIVIISLITINTVPVFANGNNSKHATIVFVDDSNDGSKTYISGLSKKELYKLRNELAYSGSYNGEAKKASENDKEYRQDYVNRVTAGKYKKNRKENAKNDLFGYHKVNGEKSQKKIAQKKNEELGKKYLSNKEKQDKANQLNAKKLSRKRQPSAYKKGARRIRNGQSIKKPSGNAGFMVRYTILDGDFVNTYATYFEEYLKAGSVYNLKYHGTGANRKYYLEFVSNSEK
jgi:hypothetical protein